MADAHPEDTESWLDVLRDLRDRGMRAPELVVGDGALGFWAALRQTFPSTREQRCWVHKVANCLSGLPKRLHADTKAALAAIYTAGTSCTGGRRCGVSRDLRRTPEGGRHCRPGVVVGTFESHRRCLREKHGELPRQTLREPLQSTGAVMIAGKDPGGPRSTATG